MGMLRDHFRPEFLNRVDEIIMFHALTEAQIGEIVNLQLTRTFERLEKERGIVLSVSPAAKKLLARKGYDPAYGARPLKRVIQRLILDPLAMRIVEGSLKEGQSVAIGAKADEIVIS